MADDDEPTREPVLGTPLPLDPLGRAVARAKIASRLFARDQPVKLGRYHLLDQVGAGGMGVVWGAWDPELARRVAIKITQPTHAADHVVREGQALAKLSHPNVVPVFDVGFVDQPDDPAGRQVFLVMEWVSGATLRSWMTEARDLRAIVRAFREAAAGLSAAHQAGLVHRDFKPENAILGDDGRVRVLDFGIAIESGIASVGGTPRYMAPEQARGEAVTAAADQYAFGVALREALEGRSAGRTPPAGATPPGATLPSWLAAIVARATAADPAERFPTMAALIAALDRDPARAWRRRLAVAGVLGLAGGAFAFGQLRGGTDAPEPCSGGLAELGAAWTSADRDAVRRRLESLGSYGVALAPTVTAELDRYAADWVGAHTEACRANVRGAISPTIYTASLGCLARARTSLHASTQVLATVSRERLPDAVVALRSLPDAGRCVTDEAASTIAPPPAAIAPRVAAVTAEIARARIRALALTDDAIAVAAEAERLAAELGYAPLVGAAALVHGRALHLHGNGPAALGAYERATASAFEAGDHATAIEAFARSLHVIASSTGKLGASADQALGARPIVAAIVRGLPDGAAFVRSLYFNNLGSLALSNQDRIEARRWFEAAARARPVVVEKRFFELTAIAGNLGLVEQDPVVRDGLLAQEVRELSAILGDDHPLVLSARMKSAMFVEDHRRAAALIDDTCRRYLTLHPHLVQRVGHCVYEQGWLAEERGDLAAARAAFGAFPETDLIERRLARGYLALLEDRPAEVLRTMRDAVVELAASTNVWSRWRVVDARLLAALAAARLGDRASQLQELEAALVAIDKLGGFATSTFVRRRRGRVLALLVAISPIEKAERTAAARSWAQLGGYTDRL